MEISNMEAREKLIKISIVMPVYTRGEYFKKAIESIYRQTFKDYELICVDDCCDDIEVQRILQKISTHNNVSVIRNDKSLGAAQSRNIGLQLAKGEYVIFLDSDDIFCDVFLENMYNKIVADESEVCVCGYKEFRENNNTFEITNTFQISESYSAIQNKESILVLIGCTPWTKLIKRSFLIKNNILFQNLSSSNDVYFSMISILGTIKISLLNMPLVLYRINSINAISRKRNSYNYYLAILKTINEVEIRFNSNYQYMKSIIYFMFDHIGYELYTCANYENNIKTLSSCMELYHKYPFKFDNKKFNKRIKIIEFVGEKTYIHLNHLKYKTWYLVQQNKMLRWIYSSVYSPIVK